MQPMSDQITVTRQAREAIKKLALPLCVEAAEKIADACNAQSSWGGYEGFEGSSAGVVTGLTHEAQEDNARVQRILKNVNAGRVT